MNIVLLAAATRGLLCLNKIGEHLSNSDKLTVFSFKEEAWEPEFSEGIKMATVKLGGQFYLTNKVHNPDYNFIWDESPDLILVIGWRYLIPKSVYSSAKIGCFVFHDSYLPEYRGFGPSVWALRNGEEYTGASLFKISDEMDEGPIVAQKKVTINKSDYIGDVVEKVTNTYLSILDEYIPQFRQGNYTLTEQNHSNATYTCKAIPDDFRINWNQTAEQIRNLIRSYAPPYPGAFCKLNEEKILVLEADVANDKKYVGLQPGRVVKIVQGKGSYVGTGDGLLFIRKVQIEGKSIENASCVFNKISMTLR
ncbi:methionyl-tRNA formyltransferase [Catenovulum sediminis]|uniref:methionyl-tRNA formyltransferase n=1 Tax=Catenovulum sediminis TaxID=1740262 RepID=UPI00118088F8|nr:methionyl-tRNA formyltransferase [Catenovulum sediminis]